MPLFGELFVSDLLKKPVLDPQGDELGRLKDFVVIKGDPLPLVSALILEEKKKQYCLEKIPIYLTEYSYLLKYIFRLEYRS